MTLNKSVNRQVAQRIQLILNGLHAQTSFYAKHLSSGTEIALSADIPLNTLSIIKIVVMVRAYQDAEAGLLDLEQRYCIQPEDLRQGSGLLQTFATGLMPTYRDLITQMIISSDNTATDILIEKIRLERINQMLAEQGYQQTRLQMTTGDLFRRLWKMVDPNRFFSSSFEVYQHGLPTGPETQKQIRAFLKDPSNWLGKTTAREISRLLEQIQNGTIASRANCQAMLDILRWQLYNTRIPQRIGTRVSVAHKTGDWPPYAGHDVGILETPNGPIVLALFAYENQAQFYMLEKAHGQVAEAILEAWGKEG